MSTSFNKSIKVDPFVQTKLANYAFLNGNLYKITLGSTGSEYQPSTKGFYRKVCTASDNTFIYKKDDDSLYLFYVEFNSAPYWAISNKIGGSSMIIKSVQSSSPYCPGPESNGVWLIITGTGSGAVSFFKVNLCS